MKLVKIINQSRNSPNIHPFVCDKFITKLMGLMFKKEINPYSGLIFIEHSESKINTSIHMFFMRFDITVLWLDKNYVIVDKAFARKWRPYYASARPAQFTLELHADRFSEFNIGDQLQVTNETQNN